MRRYWKGHYVHELADDAIEALLAHDSSVVASLQGYGGAIAEVPDEATAFSQRGTAFEYVGAVRWTDPAEDAHPHCPCRATPGDGDPQNRLVDVTRRTRLEVHGRPSGGY